MRTTSRFMRFIRAGGDALLVVVLGFTTLASLAVAFGQSFWLLDLASHFRLQWLVLSLVSLVCALCVWRVRFIVVSVALLVFHLVPVLPYVLPRTVLAQTSATTNFCMVSFNVLTENSRKADVAAYLANTNADIVVLPEVNQAWLDGLSALRDRSPYVVESPRRDNYGIALFSKFPIVDSEVLFEPAAIPTISATVEIDGRRVGIVGMHPVPPIGGRRTQLRNAQLKMFGQLLAKQPIPQIVAGDLNTSPWSAAFSDLTQPAQLADSALGRGIQPSWPAQVPLLRTPIDHILISPEFVVTQRTIGPQLGSDHLPVHVCLAF